MVGSGVVVTIVVVSVVFGPAVVDSFVDPSISSEISVVDSSVDSSSESGSTVVVSAVIDLRPIRLPVQKLITESNAARLRWTRPLKTFFYFSALLSFHYSVHFRHIYIILMKRH